MKKNILLFFAATLLSMASVFAQYNITLSANPPEGGSVFGAAFDISEGTIWMVSATPTDVYTFINWTENGVEVSVEPQYEFTVTGDRHLVANFIPSYYNIILSSNPVMGGTVTGEGVYQYGMEVVVTATPHTYFEFLYWTNENGELVTVDHTYAFTVTGDRHLVAHFGISTSFEVNVSANSPEGGTVTGGGFYPYGTEVTICASPKLCYEFVYWSADGVVLSTDACFTFVVTQSHNLVANFVFVGSALITSDKTEILAGETVVLTANVSGGIPGTLYQWYASGEPIPDANELVCHVNPEETTIYTFTATTSGCVAESNEIIITVISKSPVEIIGPNFLCGENTITLQAVTDPELANTAYIWYMNGMVISATTAPELTIYLEASPNPYCFTVNVISEFGSGVMSPMHCVYVEEYSMIAISSDKTIVTAGETVELAASISGLFNRIYKWFADGIIIPGAQTPTIYVTPSVTTTYTFTATSLHSEDCISESNEIVITVNAGVISVLDFNESNDNIIFYPNPSTGQFIITSEKIIESIELYDVVGKKVFVDTPKAKTIQINTSLHNGLYMYRAVLQDNSISSGKIIIQ